MRRSCFLTGFVRSLVIIGLIMIPVSASADHIGLHATPCNNLDTVGGGALGLSPGPVGPPNSLGWDVGSGQCNGSFTTLKDGAFPGGALELGLRAEQRSVGQVARVGANEYVVMTGNDTTSGALNRAWWNFQASIAYDGGVNNLGALTLDISTLSGPNLPVPGLPADLLALRGVIDDRNNNPNPTTSYADLYQISQNPEFGWFAPTSDNDANPDGAFDYDAEGAWIFTLRATAQDGLVTETSMCVRTPNASCEVEPVPGFSPWSFAGLLLLLAAGLGLMPSLLRKRTTEAV